MENQTVNISFWATRSYDMRLVGTIDKADYDVALEEVGDNPTELYRYLEDIGYEFDQDEMSIEDEVISDMDVYDENGMAI